MSTSTVSLDEHEPNIPLFSRVATAVRRAQEYVVANPNTAVAAAFAIGIAVGGGLSTRTGRLLFWAAARQGLRMLA